MKRIQENQMLKIGSLILFEKRCHNDFFTIVGFERSFTSFFENDLITNKPKSKYVNYIEDKSLLLVLDILESDYRVPHRIKIVFAYKDIIGWNDVSVNFIKQLEDVKKNDLGMRLVGV